MYISKPCTRAWQRPVARLLLVLLTLTLGVNCSSEVGHESTVTNQNNEDLFESLLRGGLPDSFVLDISGDHPENVVEVDQTFTINVLNVDLEEPGVRKLCVLFSQPVPPGTPVDLDTFDFASATRQNLPPRNAMDVTAPSVANTIFYVLGCIKGQDRFGGGFVLTIQNPPPVGNLPDIHPVTINNFERDEILAAALQGREPFASNLTNTLEKADAILDAIAAAENDGDPNTRAYLSVVDNGGYPSIHDFNTPTTSRLDYYWGRNASDLAGILSAAYMFTGYAPYAEALIRTLDRFLVDADSYMTPDISSYGVAIMKSIFIPELMISAQAVLNYSGWNSGPFLNYVQAWASQVYDVVANGSGNHSNPYAHQVKALAITGSLLGNTSYINLAADRARAQIDYRIRGEGYFTGEVNRGDPNHDGVCEEEGGLSYSLFLLEGISIAALTLRQAGHDIFNHDNFERAASYYAPFVENPASWQPTTGWLWCPERYFYGYSMIYVLFNSFTDQVHFNGATYQEAVDAASSVTIDIANGYVEPSVGLETKYEQNSPYDDVRLEADFQGTTRDTGTRWLDMSMFLLYERRDIL